MRNPFRRTAAETPEVRARWVGLVCDQGIPIEHVAQEHRIPEDRLRRWVEAEEAVRLERQIQPEDRPEPDVPHGLFSQFGRDPKESRVMSSILKQAVTLARDEEQWLDALPTFRSERERQPDYDVPYIWLAEFLDQSGYPHRAIELLLQATTVCRRKRELLCKAGNLALSAGDVRRAIYLLAQGIAAHPRPVDLSGGTRGAILIIAELFDAFGDVKGANWARNAQTFTELEEWFIEGIHREALFVATEERVRIQHEILGIRNHLKRHT